MIRLIELRTEKGLSQRDMAKIFNVSQGTYNNWENDRTEPSIAQLISLATFFETSVDYLIGYNAQNTTFNSLDHKLIQAFNNSDE